MLRIMRSFGRSCRTLLAGLLLTVAVTPHAFSAIPALTDSMDGETLSLQLRNQGIGFRVTEHSIDRSRFRHGAGAEALQVHGPAGESAQFVYPIPSARVIDELQLSAWVMCNRPGLQLGVRVVLPRSIDPSTGEPHEVLVRNTDLVSNSRGWEKLTIDDLPKSLKRQARVARAHYGTNLDEREAYVSELVLLVPGGVGITELIVDRIEVRGVLGDSQLTHDEHLIPASAISAESSPGKDPPKGPSFPPAADVEAPMPPRLHLQPVPRIVQWQGEPLEFLAKLGFNCVWFHRLPNSEELSQAHSLGMGIICPPPTAEQLASEGISSDYNCVQCWDLGEQLTANDMEHVVRLRKLIKRHDPLSDRTTVISSQLPSRDASRAADAMVLSRPLLGTDLNMNEYVTWLAMQQRQVRPGTPLWTAVDTERSARHLEQINALSGSPQEHLRFASYHQLATLTTAAVAAKSRGFVYRTRIPLTNTSPANQLRCQALELMNLRLRLLTPWLASSKSLGGARSSHSDISALVLQAERSQLLVPVSLAGDFESLDFQASSRPITFLVPGVSESSDVYLITMAGVKRLRHERITGGLSVTVNDLPSDGLILFTSDPQAFSQVSQFLRKESARTTRLRRSIVAARLQASQRSIARLSQGTSSLESLHEKLTRAQHELAACDNFIAKNQFELAYQHAATVDRLIAQAELQLPALLPESPKGSASPWPRNTVTLAAEDSLRDVTQRSSLGANLLPTGDFGDLEVLISSGWRYRYLELEGVSTAVRLSPTGPLKGPYCLELEAAATDPATPISVVSSVPVWVTSPSVPIQRDKLVEITGYARVPSELIGSVDGLQIIDSLGGPDMPTRVVLSPSWRRFRILRGATADTELSLSFALTGLGSAQIDDVSIRVLEQSSPVASQTSISR